MKKVTLWNDFHNTETSIFLPQTGSRSMTRTQVKRVKRRLCPSPDCICSDDFGQRGPRYRIGSALPIETIGYTLSNDGSEYTVWIPS